MRFTKMHGLGNDYLYVYGPVPENIGELSVKLSDRHFGAGSDGMIYISPSERADFKMRIFNADGSEAKMCGNGIRCVGKYVFDKGYTNRTHLRIETLSGLRELDLQIAGGKVKSVIVGMGKAAVGDDIAFRAGDADIVCTPVSVGNPHAVIFADDVEEIPLTVLGPQIEHHENFPGGVNVEFVQVLSEKELRMRVWERGAGETLACGTGACATLVAAVLTGRADRKATLELTGGRLEVEWSPEDNHVYQTGPAAFVFDGVWPD